MAVYFLRQGVTGNVKIGFASDITKRVKQLQTGQAQRLLIMRLVAGETVADEKALHRRFSHLSIGGEWFRFHPDMMGDLGMADLPVPTIGTYDKSHNWPATPDHYETRLHREILEILGGRSDFARRCGMKPWDTMATGPIIAPSCWAAAIVLLRERGHPHITLEMIVAAHDASQAAERSQKDARKKREAIEREAYWIKGNPGVAPWWDVAEENKPLLTPRAPDLAIVGGSAA